MTVMLAVVSHWRQQHTDDFAIIHDKSSNFARNRRLWDRITSPDVPDQKHNLGDGSDVDYPLRVTETTEVDSKDSPSVQLCDILAGISTKHLNPNAPTEERDFLNNVVRSGLEGLSYNGIRPELTFPDQIPPRRLSGPDVVDQMTGIISRTLKAAE